jgi:hypothetical protein
MLLKIETIVLLDDKIRHIYMSQDDLLKNKLTCTTYIYIYHK